MSGHSKWANIKHRKGKQDAIKGKVFTKLIRALTIAARKGGADPGTNSNLRLAIDKAIAANMSRDTVDRAIKRGAGDEEGNNVEESSYEGYGPSGTAFLVECLTDNKNRTVADVRHAFTKHGGNLGSNGSVAYLFTKRGVMTFAPGSDENKIMEIALDSGADDIVTNDDNSIDVYTSPENFETVKNAMTKNNLNSVHADIAMIASIQIAVTDKETAEKILKLTDALEEMDDVQNVYSNADIATEIMEKL